MIKRFRALIFSATCCCFTVSVWAAHATVTVDNFVRAETDNYMAKYVSQGGLGRLVHSRRPVQIGQQDVIRMNRDTIYSGGVFDLEEPVTITLPKGDGRFQSLQVVNQDHYVVMVEHDPGTYEITREEVGTRYVVVIIRTFMDPGNEADIAAANGLQEQIEVSQSLAGEFKVPEWDADSLDTVRGLILALAATSTGGFTAAFGSKEEVDPIQHLMGTAAGWGGNPPEAATYFGGSPERNDGTVPFVLTTKDVPVEGFWSVTVYNARGFMEKNDRDVYSYNGVTAAKNSDGSTIVHFGACDDGRENCIPITEGWNYVIRLYRPGPEVLDGSWKFPEPRPVK